MARKSSGVDVGTVITSAFTIAEVLVGEWSDWRKQRQPKPRGAGGARSEEWAEDAMQAVDRYLRDKGVDPKESEGEGGTRVVQVGSALGIVSVNEDEDEAYVRIGAELMRVPKDDDLRDALYEELLEGNLGLPSVFRFAVNEGSVFLVANLTSDVAAPEDVPNYFAWLMDFADSIDDDFKRRYRKHRKVGRDRQQTQPQEE